MLLVLSLVSLLAVAPVGEERVELHAGKPQELALTPPADPARGGIPRGRFSFRATEAGTHTVRVESFDFSAAIEARCGPAHVATRRTESGLAAVAIAFDAAAGSVWEIDVGTADGWLGRGVVSIESGKTRGASTRETDECVQRRGELDCLAYLQDDVLEESHQLVALGWLASKTEPTVAESAFRRVIALEPVLRERAGAIVAWDTSSFRRSGAMRALDPRQRAWDVLLAAHAGALKLAFARWRDGGRTAEGVAGLIERVHAMSAAARDAGAYEDVAAVWSSLLVSLAGDDGTGALEARALSAERDFADAWRRDTPAGASGRAARTLAATTRDERARYFVAKGSLREAAAELGAALAVLDDPLEVREPLGLAEFRSLAVKHQSLAGMLSEVERDRGRFSAARPRAEHSLLWAARSFDERDLERSEWMLANSQLALANLEVELDNGREAARLVESALELEHVDEATRNELSLTLAECYRASGERERAGACLRRLLDATERVEAEDALRAQCRVRALTALADLLPDQAPFEERAQLIARARETLIAYAAAFDAPTRQRHELGLDAQEAWQLYRAKSWRGGYALALRCADACAARRDADSLAFDALDTAIHCALELEDADAARTAIERARSTLDERVGRLEGDADRVSMRAQSALLQELEQDLISLEHRRTAAPLPLEQVVWRGWRWAERWKARALLGHLDPRAETDVDVEAQLTSIVADGKTLVVEFTPSTTKLCAYTFGPRGVARAELGGAAAILERVQAFVAAIQAVGVPESSLAIAELGRKLYGELLAPVLALGGPAVKRVIVIPTAGLALLPFDALLAQDVPSGALQPRFADWHFAIDDLEITYAPSVPVLAHLSGRERGAGAGAALIIANSRYRNLEGGLRGASELPDLARAREQAIAIARAFVDPSDATTVGRLIEIERASGGNEHIESGRFELYLDRAASERNLRAPQMRSKHYALAYFLTHADVDLENPDASALVLSWTGDRFERLGRREIESLEWQADVVLLLACNTAVGKRIQGEGVLSLANAFLSHGSRGVVATLWAVSDARASVIFDEPYVDASETDARPRNFHVRAGADPAHASRALRSAMRRYVEKRRGNPVAVQGSRVLPAPRRDSDDPFHWAAYVYVGGAD